LNLIPEDIGDYLDYDPESGELKWKVSLSNSAKIGNIAGCDNGHGYLRFRFKGLFYFVHRVAYFLQTGQQIPPGLCIDHINHGKADNC
jgi:hypothetical protein